MVAIFDTDLLAARKRRALRLGDKGARFLMRRAAEDLSERLATVERRFEDAAAINCLTDDAARVLRDSGKVGRLRRVEMDEAMLAGDGGTVSVQPEVLPLEPESLDLAVSLLTLHETNDTPGMLVQIRRALRPDGLFLGAMGGAGTLQELRQSLLEAETEICGGAAPRISPFADLRDIGALLQRAGFALPVTDLETLTVRYDDMFALIRDLRAMGATSALAERSRRPLPREVFLRAAAIYARRFADPDGRIRATFNMVWMSGWAPHASQQKPLKPGSAKTSLKQALSESAGKPRR
ncbi:methyltransferase domain-containing protein [Nitratireductor thuwali]|uniref:Malonyl-[acyl-carrier protein] O-methyltransferase n=1 Tax=Nitratireductor thuwali TaxID=2267699 RepID=A0ABY5MI73_9HYPH|nr:Malonyl-[acyl-carrier protein] O-methyltransferase [Nitratireductor thuwali]